MAEVFAPRRRPAPPAWLFALLLVLALFTVPAAAQWDCYNPQPSHPTTAEKTSYVNEIKVYAQEAETTYGVPAAALIAMACNESGYGWTRIGQYGNNLFGWKWTSSTAAGGRGYYTLDCQPSWDPNNKYVAFANRRDCVLFIAMKLGTLERYKDDTDRYVSDIRAGVAVTTAVNRWVAGIQTSGYNPYSHYVTTTQNYLNNYLTPSATYSSTNNLYQYSPVTGAVENVWISIDAPSPAAIVAGDVAFNASVGGGTVNTVKFYSRADGATTWYLISTDTAAPYACTWSTNPWVADGLYELKAEALNGTTIKATGVQKVTVDNVTVDVAIDAPLQGATVSGTVPVTAITDGTSVNSMKFYTRAADSTDAWYLLSTDTAEPWAANWATSGSVADGNYNIKVVAYEGATAVAEDIVAVTVKNAVTQTYWAEFTAPANLAQVSGSVPLAVTAAGNPTNNVSSVKFYSRLVGSTGSWYLISTDSASPFAISWATSGSVADGSYNLKAEAYASTTLVATKTIEVKVKNADTLAPTVAFTAPTAGAVVSGAVTITATASDAGGINRVDFYSDNGNYLIASDTATPFTISWATDPWVNNGNQTLVARAYDAAGNMAQASITVTVSNASGGATLNAGVDNTALSFTTGGNAGWYADSLYYYTGTTSIRSGIIGHSGTSWVQFTAAGNKNLRFQWRVESQASGDYLELWIDGVKKNSISGSTSWAAQDWWLAAGTHTVKLQYVKNASTTTGRDAGWVDFLRVE